MEADDTQKTIKVKKKYSAHDLRQNLKMVL